MTELQAIGLVDNDSVQGDHGGEAQKQIKLVDKFDWFLGEEFIILRDSHYSQKPPCVLVNQNNGYERSVLLNSILPRIDAHTAIFMSGGKIDRKAESFIKLEGIQQGNKLTYDISPTIGDLSVQNDFIGGHLRMRGEGGGRYPTNYLEFIDRVFGSEPNTIEVCSNKILGLNGGNSCFTVDINPEHKPDLVVDGQTLEGIRENSFSRWRCDPPYNDKTAKGMYSTELPNVSKLLKAGARVVKPGSLLFLLHAYPTTSNISGLSKIGYITISAIPNNEIRILNIYVKEILG